MSAQEFERRFWGNCGNSYGEETKQLVYARHLGIELRDRGGPGPIIDLRGRSVADLGGGPTSLLLKTIGGRSRVVVDPCPYPDWVAARYQAVGIVLDRRRAELWVGVGYDEAWIYNVLQHVEDPELVVANALHAATRLRMFEWLEVPAHEGHPHELHAERLDAWIGKRGTTLRVDEGGAVGLAYVNVT